MSRPGKCERCGAPLPVDSDVVGQCMHCLLELGLEPTADRVDPVEDVSWPKSIPAQIGPYMILDSLGEGGMGVVFLAEQQEPLRRLVALKLMKRGMSSSKVLSRFQSERQALALMNHPGIAKVFDAGEAENGRPYFVMEYVQGPPITVYCDRHRLDLRARLKLFVQVCNAIHHAHLKGIIHRDIKPSNVLVEELDGKPVVRVIDFGVAKAISQPLMEQTLFTEHGLVVGTLAYMSPEQAESTGLDVDTRSDVYSLGALLYELLVGALPIDPEKIRNAALAEMLRLIREEEPSKPTTRIEKLGETAVTVAGQRQTSVRALLRFLKGDLDWITMRALEKNPARRYASASEFAADVERHLAGEPVAAGPPGAAYRLRKLVLKHRVVAIAVLVVFVSLGVWIAITTTLYLRAAKTRELVEMDVEIENARPSRDKFDRQRFRLLSSKVIEGNRKFMGHTPDFARLLTKHLRIHYDTSSVRVMSSWIDRIDKAPEVRALEAEIIETVERALDAGDISVVDILLSLGHLDLDDRGGFERLLFKAFDLALKPQSGVPPEELRQLANLLEGYTPQTIARLGEAGTETIIRRLADYRRTTPTSGRIYLAHTLDSLAQILARRGSTLRREGACLTAEPLLREAVTLFREIESDSRNHEETQFAAHRSVLELESELGACLTEAGNFEGAEQVLLGGYEEINRIFGRRWAVTQVALNRLAALYEKWGRPEKAKTYRARLPAASVRDMWDLGPLGSVSPVEDMMSVRLGETSAVVFTDPFRPSGGWASLEQGEGFVRIQESKDSFSRNDFLPLTPDEARENTEHRLLNCEDDYWSDCHTRWILVPNSVFADRARGRALVFYSKWKREGREDGGILDAVLGKKIRIGTSLAVWNNVESPATREPTLLFGADEPAWGKTAFVADDIMYTYADSLLARVPLDQALVRSAWRFYAGAGRWSENSREARPVPGFDNVAPPVTVHWNEYLGKYLLASGVPKQWHKLVWKTADKPEGPWSDTFAELSWGAVQLGPGQPEIAMDNGRVEFYLHERPSPSPAVKGLIDGGPPSIPNETHLIAVQFQR